MKKKSEEKTDKEKMDEFQKFLEDNPNSELVLETWDDDNNPVSYSGKDIAEEMSKNTPFGKEFKKCAKKVLTSKKK